MTALACFVAWVLCEPPEGVWYGLPPIPECRSAVEFNSRYQSYLRRELAYGEPNRRAFREALAEAEWLRVLWDAAWGSNPAYECCAESKAAYRRRFRLMMGRDDFLRMDLPPCVPTWRFREMR